MFPGALLADAVGLGKTYVALAVATRYHRTAAVVPHALVTTWRRTAQTLGIELEVQTHEALSRGGQMPGDTDLVLVDEAHRFRNPDTRRHQRLADRLWRPHAILITATPVVNRSHDLVHLLRLILPDRELGWLGLPSLNAAVCSSTHHAVAHAVAPLVVARSGELVAAEVALPDVRDGVVVRLPVFRRRCWSGPSSTSSLYAFPRLPIATPRRCCGCIWRTA